MDQTGSARSYPTSTTARCGEERKAQGPEIESNGVGEGSLSRSRLADFLEACQAGRSLGRGSLNWLRLVQLVQAYTALGPPCLPTCSTGVHGDPKVQHLCAQLTCAQLTCAPSTVHTTTLTRHWRWSGPRKRAAFAPRCGLRHR
eukprot:366418-Chlamydomonas_euryale.AAC.2